MVLLRFHTLPTVEQAVPAVMPRETAGSFPPYQYKGFAIVQIDRIGSFIMACARANGGVPVQSDQSNPSTN